MAEPPEFFESLDEISLEFRTPCGEITTRQKSMHVLTHRGSWASVIFLLDVRVRVGVYKPRVAIHKYRKIGGGWRKHTAVILDEKHLLRAAALVAHAAKSRDSSD